MSLLEKYFNYKLDDADEEKFQQVKAHLEEAFQGQTDPWGLDIEHALAALKKLIPLYRHYFKVRVFGQENVPNQPCMIVSNHSGQIAIDGMLASIAFAFDITPGRILRTMVERFFVTLPFVAPWAQKGGAVLGDRKNCEDLLKRDHSILVFPEGVRGVSKNTTEYYNLQSFTTGFYRISQNVDVPVLPIAIIGAEEFYPLIYHPKKLAKLLGLPALPLPVTLPFLGPLSLLPLPSPVDIIIGKPISPLSPEQTPTQKQLKDAVSDIQNQIQSMITLGLKERREFFANDWVKNIKDWKDSL